MIAWAKPVGMFDWPVPGRAERIRMPVDLMSWGVRGSSVGVSCAFRTERIAEQLNPGTSGCRSSHTRWECGTLRNPSATPRRQAVSPLSVLGTAWLLIGQPAVSARRGSDPPLDPPPRTAMTVTASASSNCAVCSRLAQRQNRIHNLTDATTSGSGAGGEWRNQACGPGRNFDAPCGSARTLRALTERPSWTQAPASTCGGAGRKPPGAYDPPNRPSGLSVN